MKAGEFMAFEHSQTSAPKAGVAGDRQTEQVLCGVRVPNLPYPVNDECEAPVHAWRELLAFHWQQQSLQRVSDLPGKADIRFSARQINAGYLADRVMDVFLTHSGLHEELVQRVARLRFYLAWQLDEKGAGAFNEDFLAALNGLQYWRGWNPGAGRSARLLSEQLEELLVAVTTAFTQQQSTPADAFFQRWSQLTEHQEAQFVVLRERLLRTELGAARQRFADQTARALVSRALQNRRLPAAFKEFIVNDWLVLLTQALRDGGLDSDDFRHGRKLLEWLIWLGDPALSDGQHDRLYQVGEQMTDRLLQVWQKIMDLALSANTLYGIQLAMMERMREGQACELQSTDDSIKVLAADSRWLALQTPAQEAVNAACGRWYVSGAGASEQRRYFFALLPHTAEILWTNGAGVKLGFQDFGDFSRQCEQNKLRPLHDGKPFEHVLQTTLNLLATAAEHQQRERATAAAAAKARAETLRLQQQQHEQQRLQQLAAHRAEAERLRREAQEERVAEARANQEQAWQARLRLAEKQVFDLNPGHWIVIVDSAVGKPGIDRMKLAMRLSSRQKLVFVDRLGLNRLEFQEQEMARHIAAEKIRVVENGLDFDDTLSDVVGRIRGGRYYG